MISRAAKRTAIIWLAVSAILVLSVGIGIREPIYLAYLLHQHMRDIAGKQHWLSHDLDAEAVATQLRHFAAEERWDHPEKTNAPKDFFYHDDPKLPEALRRLGPSWV